MSFSLKSSMSMVTLVTFLLLINIILALASDRNVKRNTDEQDDDWIAKQALNSGDLPYNLDSGDYLGDRLAALFSSRRRFGSPGRWPNSVNSVLPEKRQIRYHQCYFNPISCFRRRK